MSSNGALLTREQSDYLTEALIFKTFEWEARLLKDMPITKLVLPGQGGKNVTPGAKIAQDRKRRRQEAQAAQASTGGPYPEPKVKPERAKKYGLVWNGDTARWVAPKRLTDYSQGKKKQLWDTMPLYVQDLKDKINAKSKRVRRREKNIESSPTHVSLKADSDVSLKSREAIQDYIDERYLEINEKLWEGINTVEANHIRAAMKVSELDMVLYRNIDISKDELKNDYGQVGWHAGDIVTFKAFSSTSRDPLVAAMYDNRENSTFVQIKVPAGTPMITLSAKDSKYGHELETILIDGLALHVDNEPRLFNVDGRQVSVVDATVIPSDMFESDPDPDVEVDPEVDQVTADEARWGKSVFDVPENEDGSVTLAGEGERWISSEYQNAYHNSPDYFDGDLDYAASRYYNYEYHLNEDLREGWPLSPIDQETYMALKERMKEAEEDHVVYRAWRRNPDVAHMEVGDEYVSPQFTSSTYDPHYAFMWAGYNTSEEVKYDNNPLWEIRIPKGSKLLMPHDLEGEVTIDAGTKFRCVGVKRKQFRSNNSRYGELQMRNVYVVEVVNE